MPGWKGWNEVDVRRSQNGHRTTGIGNISSTTPTPGASSSMLAMDSSPVTMGFTPINAPKPNHQRASETASASNQEYHGPSVKQSGDGVRQTRLMVAEYLGRGETGTAPSAAPVTTRVTRASEPKKITNASKKRPATTNEQNTSKRRKTSSVADSMPVTKSAASKTKGKGKSSNGKAENTTPDVAEDAPSQPVSLFSSSTSMETLAEPSQQTSMDVVKTSQGFGTTLYHNSQSSADAKATSTVAQPWLDLKAVKRRNNRSAQFPRDATPSRGAAEGVNLYGVGMNQQMESSSGSVDPLRTLEDDFTIGEDEGFEEAMALADSLEARPKLYQNAQHVSKRQSSTQNRKAKAKQTSRAAALASHSGPIVNSSRTSNESFIIGEDEDMEEAVALLTQTETSFLSRDKQSSQPPERKKSSNTVTGKATKGRKGTLAKGLTHEVDQALSLEEDFILVENDDEAVIENITRAAEDAAIQRSPTPPTRQWKLNTREVDENEDYDGALFSEAERQILDSIKASQQSNNVKPIVRPAFSRLILDRSPLFGASSGTTLRTCFRIGEALKEGSLSVRMNSNIVIELYARVVSSRREGRKQHFVFHDLYHNRQPYLEGTCELWDQTKLWELDTRSFLGAERDGDGVMCRAVAKMKRKDDAKGKGWSLDVLSIWQARWEDVEFVAGIYCKDRSEGAEEE